MIEPPRLDRGESRFVRQQLAFELALNAYALVAALLLLRFLLLAIEISPRVWTGSTIYGLTDRLLLPLRLLPGDDRRLIGEATIADLTAVALLLVVPVWLIVRRRPPA